MRSASSSRGEVTVAVKPGACQLNDSAGNPGREDCGHLGHEEPDKLRHLHQPRHSICRRLRSRCGISGNGHRHRVSGTGPTRSGGTSGDGGCRIGPRLAAPRRIPP
jgi:hypothetical protein